MEKLGNRQRRFVDAYIGEARGNGTRAAIIAGYSRRSAGAQASIMLANPKIKAEVDHVLEGIRLEGIEIRRNRVADLRDLHARARGVLEARASYYLELQKQYDADPMAAHDPLRYRPAPGAETGLMVETPIAIGSGRNAQLAWKWEFDKGLYGSIEHTLEQVAREVGEWSEKREVSGPDGGPIEHAVITDAREALTLAIAQELESESAPESNSEAQ